MSTVVVKECRSYQYDSVFRSIEDGLKLLGSISEFVKKGDKVLIKPNMLIGEIPERAVNTHPVVVESIARLVLEAGGIPVIGDSPMSGTASNASKKNGYDKVAEKLKIKIVDFTNPIRREFKEGKMFKSFEVDKSIVENDKIINVAKLKTHTQMYLTLCVKNMFGSIVGRDKLKWHFIAGTSYDIFAKMLLDIYSFTKPALNIIDGIVGMEGYGPLTGSPREIGALILGRDGVSVDRVACEIIGACYKDVPIFKANEELRAGVSRLEDIKIIGDDILRLKVKDFKFPHLEVVDASFLPGWAKNLIKDITTSRPYVIKTKCRACKMCIEFCPAKTIALVNDYPEINYKNCIRCYCCVEACKFKAMIVKTPRLAGISR
jgi:uncharacterized protein (DUF362 family)/Pyruvate/2-oxoacid:ferredoxin oxidoreductase delta subunit